MSWCWESGCKKRNAMEWFAGAVRVSRSEYDRGRGLGGDEGAGRTRGVYAEALAGFLFLGLVLCGWTKSMTKANRGS